jgi:phage shock protein A
MSDTTPEPPAPDYDEHGVPSLDFVRDKIEGRYATALGATELAEGDERAQEQADQQAERDRKAAERLAEIRKSLG